MLKLIIKLSLYTICSALIISGYLLYLFIHSPMNIPYSQEFMVNKGANIKTIAKELKAKKIIKSSRLFRYLAWYRGDDHKVKAGEYLLEPGLTPVALLQKMVHCQVIQHNFTIIAGWSTRQVLYALHHQPKVTATISPCDTVALAKRLEPSATDSTVIEGMLWPDTYFYTAGATDIEILRRAYLMMQFKLENIWAHKGKNNELKDLKQVVTLASILEKEANVPSEYYKISGVYQRRLKINMPLQADPTIIYASNQQMECGVHTNVVDLKLDSPYNTYKNYGLPPGPIAIPSLRALHAAVHQAKGEELYFVADGKGGHTFSTTLEEHNKAVIEYRKTQEQKSLSQK